MDISRNILFSIVQVNAGYMFLCFGPGRAGLERGLKTSGREFRPVATFNNYISICIILSQIVANVIVYAMKPNMYSSGTKNILDHKIQFHSVFTNFEYHRVVSRNTKAWSNTPRKISGGSRNLWMVREYKPSRGLGDAGSPLATRLNVTSRLMY